MGLWPLFALLKFYFSVYSSLVIFPSGLLGFVPYLQRSSSSQYYKNILQNIILNLLYFNPNG